METKPEKSYKSAKAIILKVLNASFSAWLLGILMSEYNEVQLIFHKMYDWEESEKSLYDGLITTSALFGCFLGCFFGAWSSQFPRRKTMIVTDIISLFGATITLVGPNSFPVPTICIGRLILGMMCGVNCTIVNLYINEITPLQLTSVTGSFFELFINFGIVSSILLGLQNPTKEEVKGNEDNSRWRVIFAAPFFPIIARLIAFTIFIKTETPQFYYQHGKIEEARQELQQIYTTEREVEKQMSILDQKMSEQKEMKFSELFKENYLSRTICGIMVGAAYGVNAVNIVIFYSADIFAPNGDTSKQEDIDIATYFGILLAVCITIPQSFAGHVIEKMGRKSVLLFGQITGIICLTILGLLDFLYPQKILTLLVIVVYCLTFGVSTGPITWFYVPEFCPPKGVEISTIVNWFCCVISGFSFQYMKEALRLGGTFFVFAIISFGFAIYIYYCCEETKGCNYLEVRESYHSKMASKLSKISKIDATSLLKNQKQISDLNTSETERLNLNQN